MRIVSLLPSATEVLFAIGAGDDVIGVSHDCDHPPEARGRPVVTVSAVSSDLSSVEIDRAVTETYHRGGSIYHIDPAFLERERPDIVVAQELCDVCAVTSEEARRAAELARVGARIVSLRPRRLGEVLEAIVELGVAAGRAAQARTLVAQLEGRIARVRAALADVPRRPRVLCLGWLDPLMIEGEWVPELVELAGGHDGLGTVGGHGRHLTWDEAERYGPEVIVLMPCSFSVRRTLAEAHLLGALPGWELLPAVRAGRVFAVDSRCFSRPGPRLVDGLEILARCLHPDRFAGPIRADGAARLAVGARPSPEAFAPVI